MHGDDLGQVLERIRRLAATAGIRGEVDREQGMFHAPCEFDDGGRLAVLMQPTRMGRDGLLAVTVTCPVLHFSERRPIPEDLAMELLRRNERLCYARYGVRDLEEGGLVVASVDHPLEGLDPDRLHAMVQAVVQAAADLRRALEPPA
ncbi:MAG: hypothetical protein D6721_10015 [Gammaproteobacteria bacterium]|nr:MAG: hypothetical protein D6721_10015 [Gammaproteobacteria bacterium]